MLGQRRTLLVPGGEGWRGQGRAEGGITATDLGRTVNEMLRKKGGVGKFVEFYGPGLEYLSREDQATIANMAPEYGATCGFFPVDEITLDYVMDNCVFAGSVNKVVDQLLAMREETGDFGELVYAGLDWADPALAKRSMPLIADEVMPRAPAASGRATPS